MYKNFSICSANVGFARMSHFPSKYFANKIIKKNYTQFLIIKNCARFLKHETNNILMRID